MGGWWESPERRLIIDIRPTPSGRLVDVGGFRLHFDVRGTGQPVVVLEAGTWDFGLTWSLVQPSVAQFTSVLAYDRAGLGWSDPSPKPRTADVMVDELRELLRSGSVEPPYVLVAQSFGGLVVRLYAGRHPDEVAGLVLVDSAHEDQYVRAPEEIRQALGPMQEQQLGQMRSLAEMVSTRAPEEYLPIVPVLPGLPDEVTGAYRALAASSIQGMIAELEGLEASQQQLREARITSLGDMPLVVLAHGRAMPLGIGEEAEREYERTWQEFQEDFARLSTRGELVVAEGAGHLIHIERPEIVLAAIRRVVEAVRA